LYWRASAGAHAADNQFHFFGGAGVDDGVFLLELRSTKISFNSFEKWSNKIVG
jgi:hypothetical protein